MFFKIVIIVTMFILVILTINNLSKAKEVLKKENRETKKLKSYNPRKNHKRERNKKLDNKYLEVKKNSNILMGTSFIGCLFVIIIIFLFYYGII